MKLPVCGASHMAHTSNVCPRCGKVLKLRRGTILPYHSVQKVNNHWMKACQSILPDNWFYLVQTAASPVPAGTTRSK